MVYASKEYCVFIETLKSDKTKVASKVKLSEFQVVPLYSLIDVGLDFNENIVLRNLLLELFDTRCIRYPPLENIFKVMRESIGAIVTAEHLHICLSDRNMIVLETPQYNTWVFSDIQAILIKDEFAVQPEYPNKEIVPCSK